MVSERCEKIGITLGDILEPIAPLCFPKEEKPWNGMVKIHLKTPSLDGGALLTGKRIFVLHLDGSLKIPKIAKSFDSTAPKNLLAVKIRSENIKMIPTHQVLTEVVYTSFHKGQEFEITQVNKTIEENTAYFTTASLEQCKKILKH